MILDNIRNCGLYAKENEKMKKGFDFIKEFLKNPKDLGKHQIDGDTVYAVVQEYETKAPVKFEAHKKYIDIQFIISGREKIGYADIASLELDTEYSDETDAAFYAKRENITELVLESGMFAVFYPEDGHMPGCFVEAPENVHKIVVKVAV